LRPTPLNPLFTSVTSLKGVGPRLGKLFEKLDAPLVVDLLWHLPTGIIDRRHQPKVKDAKDGEIATLTVVIDQHQKSRNPRQPYRVRCRDETGFLFLVFFHVQSDWIEKQLPIGETRVVSGKVEHYNNQIQITHPDHIVAPEDAASLKPIEPVYGLTQGLTPRVLGRAVDTAIARAPELPEWLDPAYLKKQKWLPWREALGAAHAPESDDALSPLTLPRQRLAFDELLANQLALALMREHVKRVAGRALIAKGELRKKVLANLPFSLTRSQQAAIEEIANDMRQPIRMMRLLQGDVGSGKTVVALAAMLDAVETGAQAAFMAPTELLARQHHATLTQLAQGSGVKIALLTGREKGKPRMQLLHLLAQGDVDIVVGTHALFSEDVEYKDLALAIIDEQHRFGVEQRMLLAEKGNGVDILAMTATPIPRTLMLTAYGDLDSSRLDEKPAGRKPIKTVTMPIERLHAVIGAVERALTSGTKIYWICPLVEESELSDLKAATDRFNELKHRFGERVGLVHGQMKGDERDRAMEQFAGDGIDLLVATTVVEVGVDVPDATVMVIEHAERFGLAQLHQLRGRIGRSDKLSSCLLLYTPPLGETAKARLTILRDSDDGFRIAEEDLRLRGAGEVLGTKQSGLPEMKLADLAVHGELLAVARDDVQLIMTRDPTLAGPRGKALVTLLYLFGRDQAVRYIRSG
jgi:ATP-dependent DNA helicase RecG